MQYHLLSIDGRHPNHRPIPEPFCRVLLVVVMALPVMFASPAAALTQDEITTLALQTYTGHAAFVAPWTGSVNQYVNGVLPSIPAYEAQLLAWGESYVGMTQRAMYDATGNTQHFDILLDNAEVMFANRADRLAVPLMDEQRNTIMPAFISFNDAQGAMARQSAWLVHQAFPMHSLAFAIGALNDNPALQLQYGARVAPIVADMIETMDSFDSEFYLFNGDRGAYTDPFLNYYAPSTGGKLPYNMQNAAGMAYIGLWKYTGDTRFRDRAEALAKTFKDELTPVGDRYQWRYATYNSPGSVSDISHAALDVNFVVEAYEAGIVFDDTDIQRLANTMRVIQKGSGFTSNLDGAGSGTVSNSQAGSLWLPLTNYDAALRQDMLPVFQTYWGATIGLWPALGAAKFYESGQTYTQEAAFSDTFDDLQLGRRWRRDPNQPIGDTWTTQVTNSELVVTDIQTTSIQQGWVDLTRTRDVAQDDSWEVTYDFSWDSADGANDPLEAMQRFAVELHDPLGQLIASIQLLDQWNLQAGFRLVELFGQSAALAPMGLSGSASVRISSDADLGISKIYWDDVLLLSVPQVADLSQAGLVFGYYTTPFVQSHFGTISLQSFAVGEIPLLIGDLDGDGFVGITDLNIILGAWNQAVPPGYSLADPSGDGFVGIEDLNLVLGNWNTGTPPSMDNAIPEPGTFILFLSLGVVTMYRRALCTR